DAFERWRCTYTLALPVLFQSLYETQRAAPRDVSSGRYFFCGGDSVTPALQHAFKSTFAPIREVYGLTEITPASWNRGEDIRIGSIGRPGGAGSFRLLDATGSDVPTGDVGEICLRGPHLMTGYWQDPEA